MTTYYEFKRFEETAERLGLQIRHSKFYSESVGLYPTDKWVIYANDHEMWSGDINNMTAFMIGLEKGVEYATFLGWKRDVAEKKHKAYVEKQKQKHEQKRTLSILKTDKDPGEFKENKIG